MFYSYNLKALLQEEYLNEVYLTSRGTNDKHLIKV